MHSSETMSKYKRRRSMHEERIVSILLGKYAESIKNLFEYNLLEY